MVLMVLSLWVHALKEHADGQFWLLYSPRWPFNCGELHR